MTRAPRPPLRRDDLAEAALEGRVAAQRYVEPATLQACAPCAALRAEPDARSEQVDQLLFGERIEVLEVVGGFAFGRAVRDDCVGWLDEAALGALATPTHRVQSLRAFAYAEPDLAAPGEGPFAINALVCASAGQGRFLRDAHAGWFAESDLASIGQGFESDIAAVAMRFLGTPYLHGARDGIGLDAPGLLQLALYACGQGCPRGLDAIAALGCAVALAQVGRGDLTVWANHAGIMLDTDRLIHADPHGGAVVLEELAAMTARWGAPALRRLGD